MRRLSMLTMTTMSLLFLGIALLAGDAVAQQKTLKEQLVGTWTFVSAVDVQKDGSKTDRWGPNPKGMVMFDANGRYAFVITRSDLPQFASKNVTQGTAEENKAVVQAIPSPITKSCRRLERHECGPSRRLGRESWLIKRAPVFPEAFVSFPPRICSLDSWLSGLGRCSLGPVHGRQPADGRPH